MVCKLEAQEELVHTLVESEQPSDLRSAKLEAQESYCCPLPPETLQARDPGKARVSFEPDVPIKAVRRGSFLFCSAL